MELLGEVRQAEVEPATITYDATIGASRSRLPVGAIHPRGRRAVDDNLMHGEGASDEAAASSSTRFASCRCQRVRA